MTRLNEVIRPKHYKKLPIHVKDILNYVRSLNLEGLEFHYNSHYKLTWLVNGHRCGVSFSGSPNDNAHMLNIVKRDIKRELARRLQV